MASSFTILPYEKEQGLHILTKYRVYFSGETADAGMQSYLIAVYTEGDSTNMSASQTRSCTQSFPLGSWGVMNNSSFLLEKPEVQTVFYLVRRETVIPMVGQESSIKLRAVEEVSADMWLEESSYREGGAGIGGNGGGRGSPTT